MPRNFSFPLTPEEARHVTRIKSALLDAGDKPVLVSYVARDGHAGTAKGRVMYFNGMGTTTSATIDTRDSKGRPTTVNLVRVKKVNKA